MRRFLFFYLFTTILLGYLAFQSPNPNQNQENSSDDTSFTLADENIVVNFLDLMLDEDQDIEFKVGLKALPFQRIPGPVRQKYTYDYHIHISSSINWRYFTDLSPPLVATICHT